MNDLLLVASDQVVFATGGRVEEASTLRSDGEQLLTPACTDA